MDFRSMKSLFFGLLLIASTVSAQIPERIIIYNDIAWIEPLVILFHSEGSQRKSFKNFPIALSWSEIKNYCRLNHEGNLCTYKMQYNPNAMDPFNKKTLFQFTINLSDGSLGNIDWLYRNSEAPGSKPKGLQKSYVINGHAITTVSFIDTVYQLYNKKGQLNLPIFVNNTNEILTFKFYDMFNEGEHCSSEISSKGYYSFNRIYPQSSKSTLPYFYSSMYKLMKGINCDGEHIADYSFQDIGGVIHEINIQQYPNSGYKITQTKEKVEINYAVPELGVIPHQTLTANKPFSLDLKAFLNKIASGAPKVTMTLTPASVAGLHFDPESMVLSGSPNATGSYRVTVNAHSALGKAYPSSFMLNIGINPSDKPEWKPIATLPAATVGVAYDYDLNRLLAKAPGQVTISMPKDSYPQPDWLDVIDGHLVGSPKSIDAGREHEVILVAESPTGGSTKPLTVLIPVSYDGSLRPVMKPFELEHVANSSLRFNLRNKVIDSTKDANLRISLDRTEPAIDWLHMARADSTLLVGAVPSDVPGQEFKLTFHAHNTQGGDSEPVVATLKITTNSRYKPQFQGANPILPYMLPGTNYFYDFNAHRDIFPEGIPFTIEFAPNTTHPDWLHLEQNRLFADTVPDEVEDFSIFVQIRNIPGGLSSVYELGFVVM